MEGKKVASQWVPLRQINQSFTSVCVVSSCGSLGVRYKQCEEGYKVGPSLSLLCAGRFPFVGLAAPTTGWEVSPFQTQEFGAMWSIRACLYVCEVVWLSSSTWACESEGENQDEDRRYKPCYIYIKKITKDRAWAEYELTLQSYASFCRGNCKKKYKKKIRTKPVNLTKKL